MLETLIDKLGAEMAMKELITSSKEGHFLLPFPDNLQVEALEFERAILLKGIIGERPKQNGEAFFLKTMEANLFGIGTRGGVIGLNEDGKLLTLSLELDYNSSYKDFKEKIEDFISVLDFWRKEALQHQ
jgi:Tir chaperone family protein CesT